MVRTITSMLWKIKILLWNLLLKLKFVFVSWEIHWQILLPNNQILMSKKLVGKHPFWTINWVELNWNNDDENRPGSMCVGEMNEKIDSLKRRKNSSRWRFLETFLSPFGPFHDHIGIPKYQIRFYSVSKVQIVWKDVTNGSENNELQNNDELVKISSSKIFTNNLRFANRKIWFSFRFAIWLD